MSNLLKDNKELMHEYNYDKNKNIDLSSLKIGTHRKVWWKCEKGHEWQAIVSNRIKGRGCPYCSGRYAEKGKNDLETLYPSIAKEWDYEKNKLKPSDYLPKSGKKVWWICPEGHKYYAEIRGRVDNRNCPYCAGKKVLAGYNDLESKFPNLVKEWNYEKNEFQPNEVTVHSNKKVWWKCEKGHEWQAVIHTRTSGSNCSLCQKERHTSLPEKVIYFYIKKVYKDAIENYKIEWLGKSEIDIYIPSIKTGIEYDGKFWHQNKKRDIEKDKKCFENNVRLVRFREINTPVLNSSSICIDLQDDTMEELERKIKLLFKKYLKCECDINIQKDLINIYKLMELSEKEKSLNNKKYDFVKEWNYEKNVPLKPEQFNPSSGKRVWWKCEKGHEWIASINNRKKGSSCPYCAGKKVLEGYNDLESKYPKIAKEWDYEANKIKPTEITIHSGKSVHWKCLKGHKWTDTVSHRTAGRGCPYCSGRRLLKGFNDFETEYPQLLAEWDYKKNKKKPTDITKGTHYKAWWKCQKCSNEWQSYIFSRIKGHGCPKCANNKTIEGENDLATTNPELLDEWDCKKNKDIDPTKIYNKSSKKVWWKCSKCGNEWLSTIGGRVKYNYGCPKCRYDILKELNGKETVQISLDGKEIARFSSAKEAEQKTGIFHIGDVCNKKRKTAGGYRWEYKDKR